MDGQILIKKKRGRKEFTTENIRNKKGGIIIHISEKFRNHSSVISKSFLSNFFMPRLSLYTRDRGENMTEPLALRSYSQDRGARQTQRNSELMLASDKYM